MPDSKVIGVGAGLLLGAILLGWLWGRPTTDPRPVVSSGTVATLPTTAKARTVAPIGDRRVLRPTPAVSSQGATPVSFDRRDPLVDLPTPGPIPDSLRGTEVDGDLLLDPGGQFLPGPEVLRLFDYFLSAQGEESLEATYDRIVAEAKRRLPPEAARQVVELLDTYLGYREAAARLLKQTGTRPELRRQTFEQLWKLRRDLFGPEVAEALFGPQEQDERAALESSEAQQEPALDEDRAQLSEPESAAAAARVQRALQEGEAAQETLSRELDAKYGPEATDRLFELGRARQEWRRRLDQYRAERTLIETTTGLGRDEREQALQDLRQRHFQPNELPRIELIDRTELRRIASIP